MYSILEKEIFNDLIYEYKIYAPDVARRCEAGQFIILIAVKDSERVPLTIVDYDREKGWVTIIFQIVGRSTQELALLKVGDKLEAFVGPLGVPSHLEAGKRILAIGGGVGIAPLFPQIQKLKRLGSKVDVIIGARSHEFLMLTQRTKAICDNLYLCTDDGSVGFKGFVTNILQSLIDRGEQYDEVIAIGPVVMMRAVVGVTKPLNIPTMVSLNPIMIDGTGMCGCCRVNVDGEQKFACVDGPDFDGLKVDFNGLMARQRFFIQQENEKKFDMDAFIDDRKECTCLSSAISAADKKGYLEKMIESTSDDIGDNELVFGDYADGSRRSDVLEFETEDLGRVVDIKVKSTSSTPTAVKIEHKEHPAQKDVRAGEATTEETLDQDAATAQEPKEKVRRKPDMSKVKVAMPEQDPEIRIKNFGEVALGYTEENAIAEAKRCLQCKHKPCVSGCPVNVPIPEFIDKVAEGDFKAAYEVILTQNRLPAICGRVCPQENQCEGNCVRTRNGEAVGIGRLERFVADYYMKHYQSEALTIERKNKKIAVVGAGPAGLTCAAELASKGYDVTLFEALHELGGVLSYGIPEFRLPKELVKREIDKVIDLGVEVKKNVIVGRSILFEDLYKQGFEAIFLGSGAGLPNFLGIPGEGLNGVYSANEFLTRVNLMKAYEDKEVTTPIFTGNSVAVVGGGNVAMDAARTAKRLGAEHVYIIYRRSFEELPARVEESHHAKEEQIEFKLLNNPVEILGEDGNVKGIRVVKMELGEPDASGRRRPIEIPNSEYEIPVDSVVIAIGSTPNPLLKDTEKGLETNKWGCLVVDESSQTSLENVYAGGDAVTGAATVILAMGAAKQAAQAIDEKLSQK